jgi:hypothetical protein
MMQRSIPPLFQAAHHTDHNIGFKDWRNETMLYQAYQTYCDMMEPSRRMAAMALTCATVFGRG